MGDSVGLAFLSSFSPLLIIEQFIVRYPCHKPCLMSAHLQKYYSTWILVRVSGISYSY